MLTATAEKWSKDGHSRINPVINFIVDLTRRYKKYRKLQNEMYLMGNIKNTSNFERYQKYNREFFRYL